MIKTSDPKSAYVWLKNHVDILKEMGRCIRPDDVVVEIYKDNKYKAIVNSRFMEMPKLYHPTSLLEQRKCTIMTVCAATNLSITELPKYFKAATQGRLGEIIEDELKKSSIISAPIAQPISINKKAEKGNLLADFLNNYPEKHQMLIRALTGRWKEVGLYLYSQFGVAWSNEDNVSIEDNYETPYQQTSAFLNTLQQRIIYVDQFSWALNENNFQEAARELSPHLFK